MVATKCAFYQLSAREELALAVGSIPEYSLVHTNREAHARAAQPLALARALRLVCSGRELPWSDEKGDRHRNQ